ncbi:MAG: SDR family NAD(P)-dependent oxidoreductase [Balneolaceae bacterium]
MSDFYKNKIILITGAARGIGRCLAEKISDRSPVILILWDRNPDILIEVKEGIHPESSVYTADIDVTDIEILKIESEKLKKQNLLPDIIINCAGIVIGKFFHEHPYVAIERTIQINTTGSMWVVRAFLNEMIERGSGHIVNLASASGYIGNPRMSVYAGSKWAVIGWSDSLRLEMEKLKTGIYVTTVIPGYVKTGMFKGVKAPILVPMLETDEIANLIINGIEKRKQKIEAPFMIRLVPLIRSILPAAMFDWVAGNLLGVYRSMDSFEGREPKSS